MQAGNNQYVDSNLELFTGYYYCVKVKDVALAKADSCFIIRENVTDKRYPDYPEIVSGINCGVENNKPVLKFGPKDKYEKQFIIKKSVADTITGYDILQFYGKNDLEIFKPEEDTTFEFTYEGECGCKVGGELILPSTHPLQKHLNVHQIPYLHEKVPSEIKRTLPLEDVLFEEFYKKWNSYLESLNK